MPRLQLETRGARHKSGPVRPEQLLIQPGGKTLPAKKKNKTKNLTLMKMITVYVPERTCSLA